MMCVECLACGSGSSIDLIVLHLSIHVEPDTRPMRCFGSDLCFVFDLHGSLEERRKDGKEAKNVKFANKRKQLSKNKVLLVEEAGMV